MAKQHWKNKCFIDSSWWQKAYFLQPCQFLFARLSLVIITPLQRYGPNNLILNRIFNFQSLLCLSIGTSGWINALYMEPTGNLPFLWRFHLNLSGPVCRWTLATCWSKAHDESTSECYTWRRSLHHFGDSITLVVNNRVQREILFSKDGIS
jgi:hypothetical protein